MPSAVPVLPNFFIVGAPKAGTTALYHYLDQHPQIYMSRVKEPCYFASELRPAKFSKDVQPLMRRVNLDLQEYLKGPMSTRHFGGLVMEWKDYLKLFRNANGESAIGESSVCYLWSKTAAAGIASRIPNAKIIMILRNPADRLFSQYLHLVTVGSVRVSFRECVERGLRANRQEFGRYHPFLEFGMYHDQVQRYLDLFPRERIRIYFYEDYQRSALALLQDIFRFLSVDSGFVPDTSKRHLEPRVPRLLTTSYLLKKYGAWPRLKDLIPPALRDTARAVVLRQNKSLSLKPEDRSYLVQYYRDDIQKLSKLLDRDLRGWLS
jgi:hypothetical protein